MPMLATALGVEASTSHFSASSKTTFVRRRGTLQLCGGRNLNLRMNQNMSKPIVLTRKMTMRRPMQCIKSTKPVMVNVMVSGKWTGASVTFMSEREEFQEDPKEWSYLQESKVKLYSYTGNQIKVLGCSDVRVEHNGQVASRLTTDSDQGHMTISIRLEQTVNIVHKLEEVLKEFKEVFQDELGMLKGVTAKIYTDPGATLSFYSTRPIAIICIKRKNGSRSQKQGIIEPVQFSDWAAPIIPISVMGNLLQRVPI